MMYIQCIIYSMWVYDRIYTLYRQSLDVETDLFLGPKPSTSWTSDRGRTTRNSMIMNRSALMRRVEHEQKVWPGPGSPHRKVMEMMTQNKNLDWKDMCEYGSVVKGLSFRKSSIQTGCSKAIFNVTVRSNAIERYFRDQIKLIQEPS